MTPCTSHPDQAETRFQPAQASSQAAGPRSVRNVSGLLGTRRVRGCVTRRAGWRPAGSSQATRDCRELRLAFERRVVDHALHDELAGGARGEQPEELAYFRDLPDAGQLDDVALDGGPGVAPEPAWPLADGKSAHLRIAARGLPDSPPSTEVARGESDHVTDRVLRQPTEPVNGTAGCESLSAAAKDRP